jgi:hypothetical protein
MQCTLPMYTSIEGGLILVALRLRLLTSDHNYKSKVTEVHFHPDIYPSPPSIIVMKWTIAKNVTKLITLLSSNFKCNSKWIFDYLIW